MSLSAMDPSEHKPYIPSILQRTEKTNDLLDAEIVDNFILNLILPVSMAGSVNRDALLALHEEEEMISLDRKLNQNLEILTGSSAEGLSLPEVLVMKGPLKGYVCSADKDIKYIMTSLVVDNHYRKAFAKMDSSQSSPGYTRLIFNHNWLNKQRRQTTTRFTESRERQVLKQPDSYINKDGFIIQRKITRILRKEMGDQIHSTDKEFGAFKSAKETIPKVSFSHHGPAITVDLEDPVEKIILSKDYVLALPCPRWPKEANKWLHRCRVWPSKSQIKRMAKKGCHVVPKRHHSSTDPYEFLISFSAIEKYVAHCLSINQKRVYIILKMLFKTFLNKAHLGLTSYHMKTTMFWLCERVPQDCWAEDNPFQCLQWLLTSLENYIKERNLPHYFIPENNLLDHLTESAATCIGKTIQKIRADLVRTVLDSTDIYRFDWLSQDLSLCNLLRPTLESQNITWHVLQENILQFVSYLLQKGQIHVVISIICGTTNCEVLPETEEIIDHLEATIKSCINADNDTSISGLLAMLYHQWAMECMQVNNLSCYRNKIEKSYRLYQRCFKTAERELWIIAEYYNLLSTQNKHIELVRHFISKLHKNGSKMNCFEGGCYTTVSNHNFFTVDETFIKEMNIEEFNVPTTAYIFYKAIKSVMVISENCQGPQASKLTKFAGKITHDFEIWVKVKVAIYPSTFDENIYLLLGLCGLMKDSRTVMEKYFQAVTKCTGVLNDGPDDLISYESPLDKARKLTREKLFAHPYKTNSRQKTKSVVGHLKPSEINYKSRKMTVLPFKHL